MMLADFDGRDEFRDLLNEANRSNASFYPIAPRGMTTWAPASATTWDPFSMASQELSPMRDAALHVSGADSLRTLATATDGVPILGTDTATNLRRISDDLSSYYLLGYNSTNSKFDGKFRKITVRVKRPGVTVRARPGYNGPTEAERATAATVPALRDAAADLRSTALASLGTERPDRPLRLAGGYAFQASVADASTRRAVLWVVGELDVTAARSMEWSGGGEATVTVADGIGQTVGTRQATITAGSPRFALQFPDAAMASDYLVKVALKGTSGSTGNESAQIRVTVPDVSSGDTVLGQPMLFRRGPYSGAGFQPTADSRFRKAERIRVDVATGVPVDSVEAQLLDRKGQRLSLPVTVGQREDGGQRFVTAEITLAPLAVGDYLVEVSARRGEKTDTILAAFRIVP